ncbi:MAG: DUF6130 family protein [Candidatus Tumulicola sp.]|jgi:hypothetical protein
MDSATGKTGFDTPAIAAPPSQPKAQLIVAAPLPEALARGLVVLQYRAENLRFVDVFGEAGLKIVPRIGHIHVSVDDSQWHWVDASGEPVIVQGLAPGEHRIRIDLADPTHRVIDSSTIAFVIPPK